jgi:hypothetical protein
MIACTELRPAQVSNVRDSEGQKSMPKGGTA